jgi:hypothetical protein
LEDPKVSVLLVWFFFFFWDRVSLCSPEWPWIHDPSTSVLKKLGLQVCTSTAGLVLLSCLLFSCSFTQSLFTSSFSLFCSIEAWTQGLHLEPLHQLFFCDEFSQDRVLQTLSPGWHWTVILLISASWVARIAGVSHWCLAYWTPPS